MSEFSNYLEEQILTHLLRSGTWTKPSTIAVALCTSAVTDTMNGGTIPEIDDTFGYARQELNPDDTSWSDPSAGTQGESDNLIAITFPQATGGNWGTITHIAIVDDSTYGQGNLLAYTALDATKTIDNGDTFEFAVGDLNWQLG